MIKFPPHRLHVPLCCAVIALERLAWYTLLAALVFYLPRAGLTPAQAAAAPGYLVMAAYALPSLGALFADRVGYRASVLLGLFAFAAGYLDLAIGMPLLGLALVACGNGLFKTALAAMLGGPFLKGSPEHGRAFGKLYRAINVGSLPAGFLGAWLVAPGASPLRFLVLSGCAATAALAVALGWRALRGGEWRSEAEAAVQLQLDFKEGSAPAPLAPMALLLLGAVVFWFAYNQSNSALALWAERFVDRRVLGYEVPAPLFASLNPLWVIVLGPLADWIGAPRSEADKRPRLALPERLAFGMALVCASFCLLWSMPVGAGPLRMVYAYGLLSLGELLISAGCMAAVNSWAPRRRSAAYFAGWFLATAAGGGLAGLFGNTDLRSLFGWTALATAGGLGWFVLHRGRFLRQEAAVRRLAAA